MGLVKPKSRKKFYITAFIIVPAFLVFLFFLKAQSQLIRIPVTFTSSGSPALLATIEEKTYLLQFDLGSKFQLSLNKDVLDSINDKKSYEVVQWRDAKGNFYESPSYRIPHVKIGDLVLTDIIARQESDVYKVNTTLWNDNKDKKNATNRHLGGVGRPLLEKTNLLLDFQNSIVIACNDKQRLKRIGFFVHNMIRVPFEGGTKGIIIKADTDAGMLRLALDTGATITLIRPSCLQNQKYTKDERGFSVFTTRKFSIGSNDFGSKNLFLYDIAPELHEIDGVLGMDFLKNHVVYIDYKDKFIYIGGHDVD